MIADIDEMMIEQTEDGMAARGPSATATEDTDSVTEEAAGTTAITIAADRKASAWRAAQQRRTTNLKSKCDSKKMSFI